MESLSQPRILIVDDDPSIRTLLTVVAQRMGVAADTAGDGIEAMNRLDRETYDLVVLDLSMPRMNGFDVIAELRSKYPRPAVIVLTALPRTHFTDIDPEVVHCVVRKPFDLELFVSLFIATAADMHAERRVPKAMVVSPPPAS